MKLNDFATNQINDGGVSPPYDRDEGYRPEDVFN